VSSATSVPGDTRPGAEDRAAAPFVTATAVPAAAASAGSSSGGATPAAGMPARPVLSGPVLSGLALARDEVDRSAHLRSDAGWLRAAWADPHTRVIVVERGQALCELAGDQARLVFIVPAEAPDGVQFLLGVDDDGVAYFGVAGPLPEPSGPGARAVSLREAGPLLSDRDAGLLTHAVALANWHETFTHCPRCGSPTDPFASGHARKCPVDGSEHFPRVDPAMIVLVTDPADRALLARNSMWPQRRVSILAGFVEAGESAEQAVSREVAEETGIAVSAVTYLGSQPWPMPQSLMLGFRASALGTEIQVDADEIAEANWYSRAELAAAIASGDLLLPPPVSIAHRIIESWYGTALPGSW
jgi:NAD+ diphosphatase